ncbi:MAG: HlyD family efflux transporter periplasmic adaptor subunit [Zhongshania sp.]|uniref:HlyD family secretion protein n=1 Tax=Zhongshania sp. TaxID=1971902 RepID=UPI002612CC48|nr:HlyD family efflux transporter periplasmic adaptor subunit [Zhongshania sp.]MDF1690877.1 HlyD family efflux transporter periplasmic adaptor subunit [Zhongshania sp.]
MIKRESVLVLFAMLLFGCSGGSAQNGLTGYVEAEYVYISALETGWIISSAVNEGDRVSAEQVLLSLDSERQTLDVAEAAQRAAAAQAQWRDLQRGARPEELNRLQAQLAEAKTSLTLANLELRRQRDLRSKGATSEAALDRANAEYSAANARVESAAASISVAKLAAREEMLNAAKAAAEAAEAVLAKAQWRLAQRSLVARQAGLVTALYYRQGEQLPAGAPALSLLPDDALKIRFFIPQSRAAEFAPGTTVSIHQDGGAETVNATVSYLAEQVEFTPPVIYSVANREKLVFMVEARLPPNSHLHAGQPVDVSLL